MKQFSEIINKTFNQHISLEGLNENVINKLNNIDNYIINECCCNSCCDCCGCETKCCGEPNPMIFFYSENEIVNKLKTDVKVQDLFNLHNQFGYRFRYKAENPNQVLDPLYFKDKIITPINVSGISGGKLVTSERYTQYCPELYNLIKVLCNKYKMTYPTVLIKNEENSVQLFFIKGTGSNGTEGTIKNSLLEIYDLLSELDKNEKISWSQVLDVSIDNIDDIYTFVITCEIHK